MRKFIIILLTAILTVASVFTFSSCKMGENTSVNISIYETTDGCSTFLTALAKNEYGGISTYTFFAPNGESAYEKTQKKDIKAATVACYFTKEDLIRVLADGEITLQIVYIDNAVNGEINGVWAVRNDWTEKCPTSYKKFLAGTIRAADYRAKNMKMSLTEAKATIVSDYTIKDFDDPMQYVAAYSVDNSVEIIENTFLPYTAEETYDILKSYVNGEGEGYDKLKNLYNTYAPENALSMEKAFAFEKALSLLENFLEIA